MQEKDTQQIAGYVEGLKAEYPEAKISQYVIYCFGNHGFKVFSIDFSDFSDGWDDNPNPTVMHQLD